MLDLNPGLIRGTASSAQVFPSGSKLLRQQKGNKPQLYVETRGKGTRATALLPISLLLHVANCPLTLLSPQSAPI